MEIDECTVICFHESNNSPIRMKSKTGLAWQSSVRVLFSHDTPSIFMLPSRILREEYRSWKTPAVTIVAQCDRSPFKVLVSCIISLRTKDEVTAQASTRLFERAATPEACSRCRSKRLPD